MKWLVVLAVLLAGVCGGWWLCSEICGGKGESVRIVRDSVWIRDTVEKEVPVEKIVYRDVPAEIDTMAVLMDYYAARIYVDTVVSLPGIEVTVRDSVSENRLGGRVVTVDYLQVKEDVRRRGIVVGGVVGRDMMIGQLGYRHDDWVFSVGYDVWNRGVCVGISALVWHW